MRHVHLKRIIKVSPYNPSPKWPEGYFRVLKEARIREDRFTAYADQVRSFFALYPERSLRFLGSSEIAVFLEGLKRRGMPAAEWVEAREALILYCDKFRGLPLVKRGTKRGSAPRSTTPPTHAPV